MKTTSLFRSVAITGLLSLMISPLFAGIIASDTLSYSSAGALNGASGGSGWTGGWTAESQVIVSESGAAFGNGTTAPNHNELACRSFSAYSGDSIFISMTVTASGHEGNDFFALWLDNAADGTNHGTSRLNTGLSSGNLMTRLSTGRTSTGPAVTNGVSCQLVVSYTKSQSGSNDKFDTVKWWINPVDGDFSNPTGAVDGSELTTTLTSVSYIGFRGASNEAADSYLVRDLVVGTAWSDIVTAVPEPGTFALLAGAIVMTGALLCRKAAMRR